MTGAEKVEQELKRREKKHQQQEALEDLRQAAEWRVQADVSYKMGLDHCYELGLSNAEIGKALGITEAAVRMARMRNREGITSKFVLPPSTD